jgi:hypothetical protein
MEVVCIIGERLYHSAGSACHRKLSDSGAEPLLLLTEAQAHEVGMEPCGICMAPNDENRAS